MRLPRQSTHTHSYTHTKEQQNKTKKVGKLYTFIQGKTTISVQSLALCISQIALENIQDLKKTERKYAWLPLVKTGSWATILIVI